MLYLAISLAVQRGLVLVRARRLDPSPGGAPFFGAGPFGGSGPYGGSGPVSGPRR